MRVLMSAYQCGPGMGSVSQIGWEWYSRMSRRARVTLLTHVRNREALEAAGAPVADSEIVYIDTERFAGPLFRLASKAFPKSQHAVFLVTSLDFFVYDAVALRKTRSRAGTARGWDVVHAVTPLTSVAPTRLYKLGAPLVWGPLNNGLETPRGFPKLMQLDSAWVYRIRELGRLADGFVGCSRRAAAILTATRATRRSLPVYSRSRQFDMIENGVDFDRFSPSPWPKPPGPERPLRAVFVGRLIPAKALDLLFEAMVRVRRDGHAMELAVVGDGPMRAEWQAEARRLGLAEDVTFTATVSLDQVAERVAAAHVLCLPSVRESGGAVLLEAMASRRPVIAVRYGGPGEVVDDAVGRAVPADGPETVIEGFREALEDVCRRPEAWESRADEGLRRARNWYGWDAKMECMYGLYERLVANAETER